MKLASFDIFDTVLLRRCGSHIGIFYLLAQRLFGEDTMFRNSFFLWRLKAEELSSKRLGKSNLTLEEIYTTYDLSQYKGVTSEYIIQIELEIEQEELKANPQLLEIVKQKREDGFQICFISDMYMCSSFLENLLREQGILHGREKVYVSCEHNCSKADGELYDYVRAIHSPTKWLHYGDNKYSDYKIARKRGISSTLIDTSYTEVEQLLLERNIGLQDKYELAIYAGLLRYERITNGNNGYSEIAADFVAPTYVPFVIKLLNDAKQRGIRRIYFLNRDSYIFQKIAEELRGVIYPETEFSYIFISRKSLTLPSLYNQSVDEFLESLQGHDVMYKKVSSLLKYIGITDEKLNKYDISFSYNIIDSEERKNDFLNKLFSGEFSLYLQQRAKEEYDKLIQYFSQEGVLDNPGSIFVDIGWVGTTRFMINSILRKVGYGDVLFYYYTVLFGTRDMTCGNYISYFMPFITPAGAITAVIEQYFCASPYSSTIGYSYSQDGKVIPMLKNDESVTVKNIANFNQKISCNIAKYYSVYDWFNWDVLLRITERHFIYELKKQECRVNVESLIECSAHDDNFINKDIPLVKKYTFNDIFRYIFKCENITSLETFSLNYSHSKIAIFVIKSLRNIINHTRKSLIRLLKG